MESRRLKLQITIAFCGTECENASRQTVSGIHNIDFDLFEFVIRAFPYSLTKHSICIVNTFLLLCDFYALVSA